MKKCVLGILCACIFSIAVIGCKKSDRSKPETGVVHVVPENPLNPYDSFGYMHNVILDSLDLERANGKCEDLASYAGYAGKLCKSKGWMKITDQRSSHELIAQKIVDFTNDPNDFINRMQWSDSVKTRLIGFFTMLASEGENASSFRSLKEAIIRFEQEILGSELPVVDKEVILKASSTARFSGYRWSNQPALTKPYDQVAFNSFLRQQDIPLSFSMAKKEGPGFFKRVKRWIAVSAMDVVGAVHYLSVAEGAVVSGYAGLTMDLLDKFH